MTTMTLVAPSTKTHLPPPFSLRIALRTTIAVEPRVLPQHDTETVEVSRPHSSLECFLHLDNEDRQATFGKAPQPSKVTTDIDVRTDDAEDDVIVEHATYFPLPKITKLTSDCPRGSFVHRTMLERQCVERDLTHSTSFGQEATRELLCLARGIGFRAAVSHRGRKLSYLGNPTTRSLLAPHFYRQLLH